AELVEDTRPGEPDFRIAGWHCHRRLEFWLGLLWFAELSVGPGPEQSQPGVGQRSFALDQLLGFAPEDRAPDPIEGKSERCCRQCLINLLVAAIRVDFGQPTPGLLHMAKAMMDHCQDSPANRSVGLRLIQVAK